MVASRSTRELIASRLRCREPTCTASPEREIRDSSAAKHRNGSCLPLSSPSLATLCLRVSSPVNAASRDVVNSTSVRASGSWLGSPLGRQKAYRLGCS